MAIISKSYAQKLIANNKARITTGVISNGKHYVAIDRLDVQRVDHFEVSESYFSLKTPMFNLDCFSNIKADLA